MNVCTRHVTKPSLCSALQMQWRSIEKFWRACGCPGDEAGCEAASSAIAADLPLDTQEAAQNRLPPVAVSGEYLALSSLSCWQHSRPLNGSYQVRGS